MSVVASTATHEPDAAVLDDAQTLDGGADMGGGESKVHRQAAGTARGAKNRAREIAHGGGGKFDTAGARMWPAATVEMWPVDRVRPRKNNPRTHSQAQIEQLARSLDEFGWTVPVLVDETGTLIAGHGRLLAAQLRGVEEIPVMVARGWTPLQIRAYVIADNKLALNAGWDEDLLVAELREIAAADDFDAELTGFNESELDLLFADDASDGPDPDDEVPEVEEIAVTRAGDVWQLGRNRVMCGDSTNSAHVEQLIGDERASLLHADPPYGMGKEADGVQNDNLYGAKLDEFQMAWWHAWRARVLDNGSVYIWGNAPDLWRLWYRGGLGESEPLTMRNEIVWDKQCIAGMRSSDLTQYPEASERCLFFQIGKHVFLINRTIDDFWEGWEPLRAQLAAERDKAGFGPADVKRICGNHMYGHWFTKSQWAFISRDNYEKLAAAAGGRAFTRPYDELLAEYRRAAQIFNGEVRDPRAVEFRAGRPYFDNAHDTMRDTWVFPRVIGEERFGHATPKPVALVERALKSSSRPGELTVEPFGGSGTTLIAAERCSRRCYTMEIDPRYVDVTVRRWQALTGEQATLVGTGETFERVQRARS